MLFNRHKLLSCVVYVGYLEKIIFFYEKKNYFNSKSKLFQIKINRTSMSMTKKVTFFNPHRIEIEWCLLVITNYVAHEFTYT